jgi:hypothetical protein
MQISSVVGLAVCIRTLEVERCRRARRASFERGDWS